MLRGVTCKVLTLGHQVQCGRRLCRLQPSGQDPSQQSCPAGRECVKHSYLTCFSPPCHQWGVCSMARKSPPQATTKCQPNSGHLDNSCGRITLVFNRDKVPPVSHIFTHFFILLQSCSLKHIFQECFSYCCWSVYCIRVWLPSGNNRGEYLLWAEVSSWHPRLGDRPRPSPALWPLSFESGCCRSCYSKWMIQTLFLSAVLMQYHQTLLRFKFFIPVWLAQF